MHIVTGLLISLLFSKKKGSKQSPLLDLQWPIITKHQLPGRVRFQIPLMVGQNKTCADLRKQLVKVEGVQEVRCTTTTGSVLVLYDAHKLRADLLYTILIRLLDLEEELHRTPPSAIGNGIRSFGEGLNQSLYSKTNGMIDIKTLVPLSLGVMGLYRLFTVRPLAMPTAVTMIWWAYNSLSSHNKQSGNS